VLKTYCFQFPLLGFLLCIWRNRRIEDWLIIFFQFPLLGFLLCIDGYFLSHPAYFASFNSLYWDFCSASTIKTINTIENVNAFNSLYWDFCSASSI
jgi:hypothetical protein